MSTKTARTVFTIPETYDSIGDRRLIDWTAEQGIDPNRVVLDCFRIDQDDDGDLTLHYLEFDLDDGNRRVVRTGVDSDGVYRGYAKSIRSARVSRLPDLQTAAVAR